MFWWEYAVLFDLNMFFHVHHEFEFRSDGLFYSCVSPKQLQLLKPFWFKSVLSMCFGSIIDAPCFVVNYLAAPNQSKPDYIKGIAGGLLPFKKTQKHEFPVESADVAETYAMRQALKWAWAQQTKTTSHYDLQCCRAMLQSKRQKKQILFRLPP